MKPSAADFTLTATQQYTFLSPHIHKEFVAMYVCPMFGVYNNEEWPFPSKAGKQ